MKRINTLKIDELKAILREKNLSTTGQKAELVQRLIEANGSDEIEMCDDSEGVPSIQSQIDEMREMMLTLMQRVSEQGHQINEVLVSMQEEPKREENQMQRNHSVKEIAETIPEFDPTRESSISVGQFIHRVNSSLRAYNWDEKCMLLAVYSKMKGVAKMWLDSTPVLYSSWAAFSKDLKDEFGTTCDEADVHFMMRSAIRTDGERIIDYCFRVCTLGKRYDLSDAAIIKYIREGLRNMELQNAIAAMKFNSFREMRETIEDYLRNVSVVKNTHSERTKINNYEKTKDNSSGAIKKEITCYNCLERGHISSQCTKPLTRKRCNDCKKVHKRGKPENCGIKRNSTHVNKANIIDSEKNFIKSVRINEKHFNAFLDTGSQGHLICESVAEKLPCKKIKCSMKINGICGGARYAMSKTFIDIEIDNIKRNIEVYIVDDDLLTTDLLLGQDIFNRVSVSIKHGQFIFENNLMRNFIKASEKTVIGKDDVNCGNENNAVKNKLINILNDYRDVFANGMSEIGKTDVIEMHLELDTNRPITQQPYRVPEPKRDTVNKIIDELLRNDIITKSTSTYASPIILLKKKDGSDRMCVDYRRLNSHIEKEIYPMPNIEERLQNATRYKLFTTLDLNSGYYQVPIAENSRKYTAFVTTDGLYEFKRMPFGLKNAPAVFQRLMVHIKEKTKPDDMLHYMDDILIGSDSIDEMFDKLARVFKALHELKLTLNIKKCEFLQESVEFLGHKLTPNGISPGSIKVRAIQEFKTPSNIHEVRKFLGLSGYFRKFVPCYASIVEPMRRLLQKDAAFQWDENQEASFQKLKNMLINQPLMATYRVEGDHEIHTDASSSGLAGVLLQREKDGWKPVLYYSRSTSAEERKYHSYELETLAVVETLERMRYYVYGKQVKVVTDCNAIRTAMTKRESIPRKARWWLRIQDYEITIEHRTGTRMNHVDALSRYPVEESHEIDSASLMVMKTNVSEEDYLFSMQLQDENIKLIIKKIQKKEAVVMNEYTMQYGRLYRNVNGKRLYVVPRSLRWRIVNDNHDRAGHLAVDKTIQRIQEYMWFPRMRNFVKSYIKTCIDCAYNKRPGGKQVGVYYYDDIQPIPFHTIHLDHLGPFPKSKRGNEHILVLVDAFTKYTIVKAIKSTATRHVLAIIDDVTSYIGVPTRIVTDRGTAFTSKDFGRYCEEHEIKHIQNAVRTPRANGHAERSNRTLLSMLKTTVENDRRWDDSLRNLQWSINTMRNKTTKQTPHELVYGFTPRDILKNKITLILHDEQDGDDSNLENLRETTGHRVNQAKKQVKDKYDKQHAAPIKYSINDLVLAENEPASSGESRKLEPKYKGPYVIKCALNNDRYVITDLPGSTRTKRHYTGIYASEKLKPFCNFNESEEEYIPSEDEDTHDGRSEDTPGVQERPTVIITEN